MEAEHLRNVPDNLPVDRIANDFTRRYPEFAVRTGPRPWQRIGVGVAAGAVVVAAVMAPVVLLAVLSFVLLGSSILQVVIAAASLGSRRNHPNS
ncbi:hypothetical protein ABIA39_001931 [Nocardia sp. GAS34]|uniref:hypothetical protein n=1 Tax=unclassified Nocardia TaxID=2637762 RepID=UPI003D219076